MNVLIVHPNKPLNKYPKKYTSCTAQYDTDVYIHTLITHHMNGLIIRSGLSDIIKPLSQFEVLKIIYSEMKKE